MGHSRPRTGGRCDLRMAVHVPALRAGDPQIAGSGLLALAFIDAEGFDLRDWLVAAGPRAYCLDRTRGDRVAAIEVAICHASPATAKHLRRFDGRDFHLFVAKESTAEQLARFREPLAQ